MSPTVKWRVFHVSILYILGGRRLRRYPAKPTFHPALQRQSSLTILQLNNYRKINIQPTHLQWLRIGKNKSTQPHPDLNQVMPKEKTARVSVIFSG